MGNKNNSVNSAQIEWYRKILNGEVQEVESAAKGGDIDAMKILVSCYEDGGILPRNDTKLHYYSQMAADHGDIPSALVAGVNFYFGSGTRKNAKNAGKYLSIAADAGFSKAQVLLGDLYRRGEYGLFGRKKKAFDLYERAAKQGDAEAQYALAEAYIKEVGVSFDIEKAMFWLVCARLHGDNDRQWSNQATKGINNLISAGYPGGKQRIEQLEQMVMKQYANLIRNPE